MAVYVRIPVVAEGHLSQVMSFSVLLPLFAITNGRIKFEN